MSRGVKLVIEELDYYIEIEWKLSEFPQVGDFVNIAELSTEEQNKVFERMPVPTYLHSDFPNSSDYLKYYRWQVVERCWQSCDSLAINCRRVDPTLV